MKDEQPPFQESYAEYYDIMYGDKDYDRECDYLESLFVKYGRKPLTLLDVACGTGGHALILARRGYRVTGIDSSRAMLKRAVSKAAEHRVNGVSFLNMDMRSISLDDTYDSAISMFSAVNYLLSLKDLSEMLRGVRKCLSEGALFIFDFWNGLAVLNLRPEQRVKFVQRGEVKLVRTVKPALSAVEQLVEDQFTLLVLRNDRLVQTFEEKHLLRFHFPSEVGYVASEAGFRPITFLPFMGLSEQVTDRDWNIVAVLQAEA
jgi:ubiquinone/menaquinone biosynthesis C-methylase UbiE